MGPHDITCVPPKTLSKVLRSSLHLVDGHSNYVDSSVRHQVTHHLNAILKCAVSLLVSTKHAGCQDLFRYKFSKWRYYFCFRQLGNIEIENIDMEMFSHLTALEFV
jgi:hypothetical protein